MTATFAAVDCGTNSTRLLVVDAAGAVLARDLVTTRLGEGVDATKCLADQAIERTAAALARFADRIEELGGGARVRAVATSAVRDAENAVAFFDAAERALGVRPEVLSGDEEGRLTFLGAAADLAQGDGGLLVVDIGGGSTELVVGGAGGPQWVRSLDVGCVRLTERFLAGHGRNERYDAAALDAAAAYVAHVLDQLPEVLPAGQLVGVAGTVTSVAALDLGLTSYLPDAVHHHVLTQRAIERWCAELSSMDHAARSVVVGMPPGRADIMVGGLLVFRAIMTKWGFSSALVSERDLLDGLVRQLAERDG